MRLLTLSLLVFVSLSLVGCTYSIHMVHTSGFEPFTSQKKGKVVRATAERQVFLYFNSDTNYVDEAYEKLQRKCPKGNIVGITTEFQTALQPFSYVQKIFMKGRCV